MWVGELTRDEVLAVNDAEYQWVIAIAYANRRMVRNNEIPGYSCFGSE
jgi:hypothetical protein